MYVSPDEYLTFIDKISLLTLENESFKTDNLVLRHELSRQKNFSPSLMKENCFPQTSPKVNEAVPFKESIIQQKHETPKKETKREENEKEKNRIPIS